MCENGGFVLSFVTTGKFWELVHCVFTCYKESWHQINGKQLSKCIKHLKEHKMLTRKDFQKVQFLTNYFSEHILHLSFRSAGHPKGFKISSLDQVSQSINFFKKLIEQMRDSLRLLQRRPKPSKQKTSQELRMLSSDDFATILYFQRNDITEKVKVCQCLKSHKSLGLSKL